jgi:hypothetical protein
LQQQGGGSQQVSSGAVGSPRPLQASTVSSNASRFVASKAQASMVLCRVVSQGAASLGHSMRINHFVGDGTLRVHSFRSAFAHERRVSQCERRCDLVFATDIRGWRREGVLVMRVLAAFCLSLSPSLPLSLIESLPPSLPPNHPPTHPLFLIHSLALPPSLLRALSHSLSLSLSLSLALSLSAALEQLHER